MWHLSGSQRIHLFPESAMLLQILLWQQYFPIIPQCTTSLLRWRRDTDAGWQCSEASFGRTNTRHNIISRYQKRDQLYKFTQRRLQNTHKHSSQSRHWKNSLISLLLLLSIRSVLFWSQKERKSLYFNQTRKNKEGIMSLNSAKFICTWNYDVDELHHNFQKEFTV